MNKMGYIVIAMCGVTMPGCCLFFPNDLINSFWESDEKRIESFKKYTDSFIGKPFFRTEKEACSTDYFCEEIGGELVEYTPRSINNNSCVITWTVDRTGSGEYKHSNGIVFDIAGYRVKWRYISDPANCLFEVDHCAPW